MRLRLLLVFLMLLEGCTSFSSAIKDLEAHHVNSCIYASGMYPPFIMLRIFSATGIQTVQTCRGGDEN